MLEIVAAEECGDETEEVEVALLGRGFGRSEDRGGRDWTRGRRRRGRRQKQRDETRFLRRLYGRNIRGGEGGRGVGGGRLAG